jgi:hypothetical protein
MAAVDAQFYWMSAESAIPDIDAYLQLLDAALH